MALSCSEVNAAMGRIVACPTAGSCGIVPAAVLSAGVANHKTREEMINALFVATGVGMVIGEHATLAGADGGCQAECGAAASMAAAAVVSMMGGTDHQAIHGAAIALKNMLGLVCDPVGGLVEVPCVYRNVGSSGVAFTAADMVLSGIRCPIDPDEVIQAMKEVGDALPSSLRLPSSRSLQRRAPRLCRAEVLQARRT
jgi:L-serine dehydratase